MKKTKPLTAEQLCDDLFHRIQGAQGRAFISDGMGSMSHAEFLRKVNWAYHWQLKGAAILRTFLRQHHPAWKKHAHLLRDDIGRASSELALLAWLPQMDGPLRPQERHLPALSVRRISQGCFVRWRWERKNMSDDLHAKYKAAKPEERQRLIHEHDCPKAWEFFRRWSVGSKLCPSCLLCGHQKFDPALWAIRHMELPDIYICKGCVDSARTARPEALRKEPVAWIVRYDRDGAYKIFEHEDEAKMFASRFDAEPAPLIDAPCAPSPQRDKL